MPVQGSMKTLGGPWEALAGLWDSTDAVSPVSVQSSCILFQDSRNYAMDPIVSMMRMCLQLHEDNRLVPSECSFACFLFLLFQSFVPERFGAIFPAPSKFKCIAGPILKADISGQLSFLKNS